MDGTVSSAKSRGTVEYLEAFALTMLVVLATHTRDGEIVDQTYGFPGSETALPSRGPISASP